MPGTTTRRDASSGAGRGQDQEPDARIGVNQGSTERPASGHDPTRQASRQESRDPYVLEAR